MKTSGDPERRWRGLVDSGPRQRGWDYRKKGNIPIIRYIS